MLLRRCPGCRSSNVRRSSFHGASDAALYGALSPYRCNDCQTFFRFLSKEFQVGVAVILSIMVASVVVIWQFGAMPGRHELRVSSVQSGQRTPPVPAPIRHAGRTFDSPPG